MTQQLCAHFCSGFLFYGTENGNQCFCGNVLHDGYPRVPDSECNSTCSGNSSVQCGGTYRLSLYSTSAQETGPPIPSYTALGCYVDQWDRGLPNLLKEDPLMTPMLCAGFCQGFTYMGLEYSYECMCGNSWPANYSQVPDQECNATCSGDPTQTCGGTWRLNLFLVR
jgi:hypothetical protein